MDLREILKMQKNLDTEIMHKFYKNGGEINTRELLTDKLIALFTEVAEFSNELETFKYWKQNKKNNSKKVLEEFVDILFFYLSIANELEFDSNDIEQMYLKKYKENERRIKEGY